MANQDPAPAKAGKSHPTPAKLAAYGSGTLGDIERTVIESHLASCDACCQKLAAEPPDALADLVRAAATRGATEAGVAGDSQLVSGLPVELARHPRYQVLGLLGIGGMGAVYKAQHKLMDRTVAVKVISRRLVDNPHAIDRFQREVRAAARLTHANIVTALDAEQAGDTHFLVMEYVEGQCLDQVVGRQGPLSVQRACHFIVQACQGLQHAADCGMVHRDLKPHNLMLTPKNIVKILDFGLARLVSEAGAASHLTQENTVMGTPDYIAPEQATDARIADVRSDIYSLGCTLYFLLTGQPPYPGGTSMQKILSHIEKAPRPLAEVRPELPAELQEVLDRMLAKDPGQRFQKPAEAAQALLPFVRGEAKVAAAAKTTLQTPVAITSARARAAASAAAARRRLIMAGALVLFASLAMAGWLVLRVDTPAGTLVIKSDDPNVEVVVSQNGQTVRIIDAKSKQEIRLDAGEYQLTLKGEKGDLRLSADRFTLTRDGRQIVEVTREPRAQVPPPTSRPPPTTSSASKPPPSGKGPVGPPPPPVPFAPLPGKEYVTNSIGMQFVKVPAGKFLMGSPAMEKERREDEGPQHEVEISRPLFLGVFEVTQEQYERVMGTNPSSHAPGGQKQKYVDKFDTTHFPVERTTFPSIEEFCRRLAALPAEKDRGRRYRLPTEAEWEYACRAGADPSRPFNIGGAEGPFSAQHANINGNYPYAGAPVSTYLFRTTRVGSYPPNDFGLYDMHGNVWEWCQDFYGPYAADKQKDPQGMTTGSRRVVRGCSWGGSAAESRAAFRGSSSPSPDQDNFGFRVVLEQAGP